MSTRQVGSLARVNQFVRPNEAISSVFTLHHWMSNESPASDCPQKYSRRRRRRSRRGNYLSQSINHNNLLLIKIQESAINFMIRWCLLENSSQINLQQTNLEFTNSATSQDSRRPINFSHLISKHQDQFRPTQARLLLRDVRRLRKRNLSTFVRYVFWRWLTIANVIELLLLLLFACCCAYQCYELLEDYYNYPTHVIVTTVLNDDFRTDLPAVTLCDNNRVSKETLANNFPELNASHFLAMTMNTFYSVNNFTLSDNWHDNKSSQVSLASVPLETTGDNITLATTTAVNESEINWPQVVRFLSHRRPAGHFNLLPHKSIIDSLVCANIAGERISCDNLRQITSIQGASLCRTLFHDSVLWDSSSDDHVKELERTLARKPVQIIYGDEGDNPLELLEFDESVELRENQEEVEEERANEQRLRLEMDNMEIIRMRIDFHASDYGNPRGLVGGELAVHSSSTIGEITHKSYKLEPGNWYTYYIERSDHHRLPPPYNTRCYDYDSNRNVWHERQRELYHTMETKNRLIRQQTRRPSRLLADYGEFLRTRAMGKRECIKMCLAELSSTKCGCWSSQVPYVRGTHINTVDVQANLPWCNLTYLMAFKARQNGTTNDARKTAVDDLFYQICSRDFVRLCLEACPDECYYSSFEVIQQSRSWPSHEAQRYNEDKHIWKRLRKEAECCATISILYTSPGSTSLMTEPKYTRQDIVTIISGTIEAWLGLSAVSAYLFFERLYQYVYL